MIREILVSARAKRDFITILNTSLTEFGPDAQAAYKALLDRALLDLAEDAERPAVQNLSDVKAGVFGFHLRHSRKRVSGRRVRAPRHVILFRVRGRSIVIVRVLHERMLPSGHL